MKNQNQLFDSFLEAQKGKLPKFIKTGTTIAGMIFKDGVVLGADTRATSGPIIAVKNCIKIHHLTDNIYCCGAGTAADADYVTRMVSSKLKLYLLTVNEDKANIDMAKTLLTRYLYQYQGHVSAALIIGGVDHDGPKLYNISPNGFADVHPYITMGSGSMAALSILESRYRKDMDVEEAKKLVHDSIAAGVFNDLGSGSNIDLCVITKDSTQYLRNYDVANVKGVRHVSYKVPRGTTKILKSIRTPIEVVSVSRQRIEPMEE